MRKSSDRFLSLWALLAIASMAAPLATGCIAERQFRRESKRDASFDLLERGRELKAKGDFILARDVLFRAAETSPRAATYYEIANCYLELGQPELAIQYYDQALKLTPEYPLAIAERDLALLRIRERAAREDAARAEAEAKVALAAPTPTPTPAPTPEPTPEAVVTPAPVPPQADDRATTGTARQGPAFVDVVRPKPASNDQDTGPTVISKSDPPRRVRGAVAPPKATPKAAPVSAPAPIPVPIPTATQDPTMTGERLAEMIPTPTPAAPPQPDPEEVGLPPRPNAFTGLAQAMGNFGGTTPKDSEKKPEKPTTEQVRQVIFPEMAAATLDLKAELARASTAEALGRHDEAVRSLTGLLSAYPNRTDLRLRLARALQRSGRTQRAEEELLAAVKFAPTNAEVAFQYGNFLVETGEISSATGQYTRAIGLSTTHLNARNNLAALQLEAGNGAVAEGYCREILAKEPDFRPALLNLALALDQQKRPAAEVLATLEKYARLGEAVSPATERWMRELRARRLAESANG